MFIDVPILSHLLNGQWDAYFHTSSHLIKGHWDYLSEKLKETMGVPWFTWVVSAISVPETNPKERGSVHMFSVKCQAIDG